MEIQKYIFAVMDKSSKRKFAYVCWADSSQDAIRSFNRDKLSHWKFLKVMRDTHEREGDLGLFA